MEIIAHRGDSAHHTENTAAAFTAALTAGADGIETDLRLSADGEIFLFHDDSGRRLLDRTGRVEEATASEIRQWRYRDGQPLLALEDFFTLLRSLALPEHFLVNLELKGTPTRLPLGDADKRSSDENDREESLALIRELAGEPSMREGLEREALLRILCDRLGFERLGAKIRNELDTDLITAVERRILLVDDDHFQRDSRSIEDYPNDELREHLRAAIGKTWTDQDEAIRQTARHLGFRRAGPVIQESLKSAITGALRTGELERGEDGRLRAI